MGEGMRSPEEMAEINKSRLLSDAEAVKGGAGFGIKDTEGKIVEGTEDKILFTEKQKGDAMKSKEAEHIKNVDDALSAFSEARMIMDNTSPVGVGKSEEIHYNHGESANGLKSFYVHEAGRGFPTQNREVTIKELEDFYSRASEVVDRLPPGTREISVKFFDEALSIVRQEIDQWIKDGAKFNPYIPPEDRESMNSKYYTPINQGGVIGEWPDRPRGS